MASSPNALDEPDEGSAPTGDEVEPDVWPRILFLDQNAWIALARGAWDRTAHPGEHAALTLVAEALQAKRLVVPLGFANIYETHKINDPVRRGHLARVQATISAGIIFRSRRYIFERSLVRHLSARFGREIPDLPPDWFLSPLFFEAAADYSPEVFGFEISEKVLAFIRQNPAAALFNYLFATDEEIRIEAVRRYSAGSADLMQAIEARRKLAAGETFALRRRAYSARLVIDELDFILAVANQLDLGWSTARDIGPSLTKSLVSDIPIMNVERELVVRLEDQTRAITENDLRDMLSFSTALPLADVLVGEKPFVGLARQARLGEKYGTTLLTDVTKLTAADLGR
jgi:hypothetical protein